MPIRLQKTLSTLAAALLTLLIYLCSVWFIYTPLTALFTAVVLLAIAPAAVVFIWRRDLWVSIIVTLIVLAASSMLVVAWSILVVPIQDLRRQELTPYQLGATTLSGGHSGQIRVYSDTATLQLVVQSTAPLTQALPVTVTIDPTISFGAISASPNTVAITQPQTVAVGLTFAPSSAIQTATLRLRSQGTVIGSTAPWESLSTATLTVTINGKPITSTVELESLGRATLRSFIDSELGERSPLVLLTASMLGLVAWFFLQRERKREQAEQARHNVAAQHERDQERAQAHLEQIRAQLRAGALQEVRRYLQQLSDDKLSDYVAEDVKHVRNLLAFGQDQTKYPGIEILLRQWPEEVAGTLCAFARELPTDKAVPQELYRALRQIPIDRIPEAERIKVQDARRRCGVREPQPKEWPLMVRLQGSRSRLEVHTWRDLNIFPARKAEQDLQLFDHTSPTFFPHPLYERLVHTHGSSLVWGRGSGRTALAQGVGLFHRQPDTLGCYLAGMPAKPQIGRAFAWQMLRYIVSHPTRLVSLSDEERAFSIACCTACLGAGLVLAQINRAERERKGSPPWQDTRDAAMRALWEHEAETQTALLRADIAASGRGAVFPGGDWSQPLCEAARLLGFTTFRVVFDVAGSRWADWAAALIDASLASWTEAGITFTLLVPGPQPLAFAEQMLLPCEELHWRPLDNGSYPLETMLNIRCSAIVGSPTSLEEFFEYSSEDVSPLREFQEIVRYDLQRLITVWHELQKRSSADRRVSLGMVKAIISA